MTTEQIAPPVDPTSTLPVPSDSPSSINATSAAPAASQGTSVYVGDLDPNVSETSLFEHFQSVGAIVSVRICRDAITRRSLGYGYVNFISAKDAEKAIQVKNYTRLGNMVIRVMTVNRDPLARKNSSGNVFIKNLGTEITTQALHDLFLSIGVITSCKVVLDEKGQSRGYGYVHFSKEEDARNAIDLFNGKKMGEIPLYVAPFLRRNIRIEAMILSFTNVYIKNILPNITDEDIKKFFAKFGSVTSTCTKKDRHGRVFGFCNFANHTEAVKAIEELHEKHIDGLVPDDSVKLYVQRAQKKNERVQELRSKYEQCRYSGLGTGTNLYVKNFGSMSTAQLRDIFAEYGDISSIYFSTDEEGQSRGYGFVSFTTAEAASRALRELNGRVIGDRPLYVNVAQRKDARKNMLQMQFMRHLMTPWNMGGSQRLFSLPMYQAMMMGATGGAPGVSGGAAGMPNSYFASHPYAYPGGNPWIGHSYGGNHSHPSGPRRSGHPRNPPRHLSNHAAGTAVVGSATAPSTTAGSTTALASSAGSSTSYASRAAAANVPRGKSGPTTPAMPMRRGAPVTPGTSARLPSSRATPISLPATPSLGPITWEELKKLTVEEQFNTMGERLYVKIAEILPEHAPKITGMLLEMDIADLYVMLNQPEELKARIKEAHEVLMQYQHEHKAE